MGGPVTGTDADGDVLTYQLGGDDADDASVSPPSPRFSIDPATGQIKTVGKLDYENPTDEYADTPRLNPAITAEDNTYEVVVTAYDAAGMPSVLDRAVVHAVTASDGGHHGDRRERSPDI